MDNITLALLVVTNLMLVLILGILAFLVYRLIKQQRNPTSLIEGNKFHPDIVQRMKQIKNMPLGQTDLFCPNHRDEPGEVTCAICDRLFCKACIRPLKTLHFCREHLPLIMHHSWEEVLTVKTSTHDPEEGVRLYDAKKHLFETRNLPTYIETHYKINVDRDYIETYLVVFAMKENIQEVRESLQGDAFSE